MTYADTSALVKLLIAEAESAALAQYLAGRCGSDVRRRRVGYWAVPSFSLLNQPELPEREEGRAHFLVHILIVVPLVTGLLALRNYVKADRPNR